MPAGPRRRPWTLALIAAVILPLASQPAAGQTGAPKGVEFQNIRVGFKGQSKIGTWTPVRGDLIGGTERFTGTLELTVPDDSGTPTTIRQPVDVAPGETRSVTGYVRSGGHDGEIQVRLVDTGGRARFTGSSAGSSSGANALLPDDTLVLLLGNPQGVEGVSTLPGFSNVNTSIVKRFEALKLDAPEQELPGRWYGYDAAEAVVLDGNAREVLSALDTGRGEALKQWVARGGHLILSAGSRWQQLMDSSLREILPALPSGQIEIDDLRALESFAGSTAQIEVPEGRRIQVTKLEPIKERGARVLSASSSVPLVVRGRYGFGRVTLLAIDVDQRPFSTWDDRSQFWVKAIDLRRAGGDVVLSGTQVGGGRFAQNGVRDLAGALRTDLEQFPGVRLIPFGWVAFFIFLYILLIGPGDYFFLKKVLKGRMELTWLTFPAIVVVVSSLAYWAAYVVKGTALRVNQVDAVDVDQEAGLMRGTSWVNLFSPQNRDYDVSIVPQAFDATTPDDPSQAKAPQGIETLTSWFSSPESGFGGMGGGGIGFSGGGYSYEPVGGAERLSDVRVPIWSTRCVSTRWFGPAPRPLIKSELTAFNVNQLNGTITNLLDVALKDVMVAFNDQVYLMPTIEPGATVRVELDRKEERRLSNYLNDLQATAGSARAKLVRSIMFHDAGAETITSQMSSDPLSYIDLSGQLALDRPMLVATVDRPGAILNLSNASAPPQTDRTTVLRVILGLSDADTEGKPKPKSSAATPR
ncbi:hypothetical protein EP7_001585 [Isosphaeraceae bacterium EP7]